VFLDGTLVGTLVGAPSFVNARWDAEFGAGMAPAGPMIVVCTGDTPGASPTPPAAAPKLEWSIPSDYPAGFLQFDAARYEVRTSTIAGTLVEVAVHEELTAGRLIDGKPGMGPDAYAELVFTSFRRLRTAFGDFPYDRYRVVVRGPGNDPLGYFITSEWGLDIAFEDSMLDATTGPDPGHGYTWPFAQDFTVHEITHAWNGQFIEAVPTGTNVVFPPETWLVEGGTVYYTARASNDAAFYRDLLEDARGGYLSASAADRSLSFAQLAARTLPADGSGGPPPSNQYVNLLYWKGALVCYLLDEELREHGSSLDELMRYLYVNFGLEGRRYTSADVRDAASELAGADLGGFFSNYVFGGAMLPLSGDFNLHLLP
jgi:hypothetical protein